MKKNIVWLASYPKSGNTWFRIFLSNLRSEKSAPIDINEIQTDGISSSMGIFEKAAGIEAHELTYDEADLLRPSIFRYYSSRFDDFLFVKAHDAYTYLPDGSPLFPTNASFGVIYLVRNPLDVAVSWAFHNGKTTEKADKTINTPLLVNHKKDKHYEQLRQQLLSWRDHYKSWTQQKNIPTLVLRYEDMKQQPLETFGRAVRFLGWEYSDEAIGAAIEKSSFKNLQQQEGEKDFKERLKSQKRFFRKGQIGDWKNHLSHEQARRILQCNQAEMVELGYDMGARADTDTE